jgi:chromosome segregation ATPase
MSSDQNTFDTIPQLKPDREDIAQRQGGRNSGRKPQAPVRRQSSGGWLLVLLCLAAVAALAYWTYMLNQQLQQSRQQLADTSSRLRVLESRLSVTDESVNQSSEDMQGKISEIDSEIRKLWDNVWKKAKEDLARQGKELAVLQTQLKTMAEADKGFKKEISEINSAVAEAKLSLKVAQDQLESSSKLEEKLTALEGKLTAQQATFEEFSDRAGDLSSNNQALEKRLAATEEWVDSFNGYRTQMNRKLLDLQSSVNALQTQ